MVAGDWSAGLTRTSKTLLGAIAVGALCVAGWFSAGPIRAQYDKLTAPTQTASDKGASTRDTPPPAGGGKAQDSNIVEVDADTQKRMNLATASATMQAIVKPVRASGVVAFDERRVTHLKPRTSGRVLSLAVQPGDRVTAGQVLASLDASGVLDARNGVEASRAALREAQATAAASKVAAKRAVALVKIGGVSTAEVEQRQVEEARAQAAVESAQAKLTFYLAQYDRLAPGDAGAPGTSSIVSPLSGVVVSAGVTLGETVDTNQDAFTVADPSRVLVVASLFGSDVGAVKPGNAVVVDAPVEDDAHFDAKVLSVNASLDPLTNAVPARIEVANPQYRLKANMFVTVTIAADLGRRGVTIPAASVQLTDAGPVAFVRTGETRFERRALTLGLQRVDWVEVKKGVAAGETVATKGSFELKAALLRSLLGSTD